jgi:DNA primase
VSKGKLSKILQQRGVTKYDVEKWQLGFDQINKRDLFPLIDLNQELVGITGRRIHKEQVPKYYHYGNNPEAMTEVFFGEHLLDLTIEECILVEGPLDAIKTGRYYPNVLGQCGVQLMTDARLKRLRKWFRTVTLLYDGDAAGTVGMFKVGLSLYKHFVLFVAFLPSGLDPFDASPDQIRKAIEERTLWALVDWGEEGDMPGHKK